MPIEPAWPRCDEDTRGLEAGRGGGAGGMRGVGTVLIVREAEAELVIKRNMYTGGDWGGGGEREEQLGAYFIPSS